MSSVRSMGCPLILAALLVFPCARAHGEDASFSSIAMSYVDKALHAAKGLFSGGDVAAEITSSADPDQVALETALTQARNAILLQKGNQSFTQSRWGATPAPYQIEALELVPYSEGTLNETDRATGIDRRITYEFRAKQHRKYHDQTGWGRWAPGLPPHLESITLVREDGIWKVGNSPLWAYSLR